MLISADGVELSSTAAVGQKSANWTQTKQFPTAVLVATDLNLLNCGSSAVARTTSYCCRPVVKEIRVCGGEYSSGSLLISSVRLRSSGPTAGLLRLSITPPQQQI